MKFTNSTALPAEILVGSTGDCEQVLTVALKLTLTWGAAGESFLQEEKLWWPICREPSSFADAALLPDLDYRSHHIDILPFLRARSKGGTPAPAVEVGVASGSNHCRFLVFGDRKWEKRGGSWAISEPQAFTSMSLSNDRAYGGKAIVDGVGEASFPLNPGGRGFSLKESNLEAGVSLPNIERPDSLISSWEDQPTPACLYKPKGGLLLPATGSSSWAAAQATVGADGKLDNVALARIMFRNSIYQASPDLIWPRGSLGRTLTLRGVAASGDLAIALPPERGSEAAGGPMLAVKVGGLESLFGLEISSLLVVSESRTLVVLYRKSCRYEMRAGEERECELKWIGAKEFACTSDGTVAKPTKSDVEFAV